MNKEIIEKIQKLLSLANSDNLHEAELASKKAQELLIKYNLSTLDVEVKTYETDQIEINRAAPEDLFIHSLLIEFFFVYIYLDRRSEKNKYVFNGSAENLAVAMYIRSFLSHSFKSLYALENKKQNWSGKNKKAFYLGLFKGLKSQLTENRQVQDAGNALIIVSKGLERLVKANIDGLKNSPKTRVSGDRDAINTGYDHGRNLKIAKGLDSSSTNTGKFLK